MTMPALRKLFGWSPSDNDDRDNLQMPFDNSSPSPSTLSPVSPLSPALYSIYRQPDSSAKSPVSHSSTPISSRRGSIDSGYSASSDRRVQRNLERDPAWVPRPRNAFIIFRCEYARDHCNPKDGSSSHDTHAEKTLSKRAGDAWKELPESEREHFRALAVLEKEAHARRNPNYRFRPVKRSTPTARSARPWPDVRQLRSKTEEIPQDKYMDYDGVGLRRWEARRFSESQVMPNELLPVPAKVDKSVKATRRRSSSVPLPGTEGQYLQPWLMGEAHLLKSVFSVVIE